uniref:Uncharacterized protein n=2 Tax=Cyprinus carpio TaxID=7962 RepID=A0A8C1N9W0_CYPCA
MERLFIHVRIIGSSTLALCYITSGAAEAYYQLGLHCWDIIRETGGHVRDTTGHSHSQMCSRALREYTQLIRSSLRTRI